MMTSLELGQYRGGQEAAPLGAWVRDRYGSVDKDRTGQMLGQHRDWPPHFSSFLPKYDSLLAAAQHQRQAGYFQIMAPR